MQNYFKVRIISIIITAYTKVYLLGIATKKNAMMNTVKYNDIDYYLQ